MEGMIFYSNNRGDAFIDYPNNGGAVSAHAFAYHHGACQQHLGLPQSAENIPLSPSAYHMDRPQGRNYFVMGTFDLDVTPPIHIALPYWTIRNRPRFNKNTGVLSNLGNMKQTWMTAKNSRPEDGVFIDVGGWIGDSALPSAALGFDTYVFEPVRYNTDLMHYSLLSNDCKLSKHLTIVNAMVGAENKRNETVFVSKTRSDNSAATKKQALLNIAESDSDWEQPVEMIALDSFFPPSTKVQNLKIDVQGYELNVLRGAKRILTENKGRLKLRFEKNEPLLRAAGSSSQEVMDQPRIQSHEGGAQ